MKHGQRNINNCPRPLLRSFNIFFGAAAKQNTGATKAAAKEARALMARLGVAPDRITVNAQISRAVKEGRLDEAIETFGRLLDGVRPALGVRGPHCVRGVGRLTRCAYPLILKFYSKGRDCDSSAPGVPVYVLPMNPSILRKLTLTLYIFAFRVGKSLGVWLRTCIFVSRTILEARKGTQHCSPLALLYLDQTLIISLSPSCSIRQCPHFVLKYPLAGGCSSITPLIFFRSISNSRYLFRSAHALALSNQSTPKHAAHFSSHL